ncbi:CPBP family intramembrane glutamic endopeptidase [Rhodococcus sp. BUPNP1]|uniref:CPBP family intramembrane glutamic endopeptidase n=1 Tax=Rhodococcus sp. BUPNP1 TaxID=1432786 RepID=UPI00117BAAFA|nr:CPBP family intramembrane glutamic endopeptidase [Rhodococcus sp. BUPNP1]
MTQPRLLRFWVVFAITTVPFYLWGALTDGELDLAGARLPISALMFVCPALAALAAGGGRDAAGQRMRTPPRALWLIVALVVPSVLVLVASIAVAGTGPSGISVSLVAVTGAYFVAAVCEELGWTAVLMPALLRTRGVLSTGAVIGVIWALWHLIPHVQAGYGSAMLLGQLAFTVVFRMLLVQMTVAGGGAPIIAVVGHASSNVAWTLLAASGIYSPVASAVAVGVAVLVLTCLRVASRRVEGADSPPPPRTTNPETSQ